VPAILLIAIEDFARSFLVVSNFSVLPGWLTVSYLFIEFACDTL
jgi:hypothetical protein